MNWTNNCLKKLTRFASNLHSAIAPFDTLLQSLWQKQALPGTRTLPCTQAKRLALKSNNGKQETPSARAKRRRKAATALGKAAAGERAKLSKATEVQEISAGTNTEVDDPVEIATKKPPKQRVDPPAGHKNEETNCTKKGSGEGQKGRRRN